MDIVLNVMLVMMLLSFVNFVRYLFKVRKIMKMHKDNPNITGFTIVNGEVKPIEGKEGIPVQSVLNEAGLNQAGEPSLAKKMVTDAVCGKEVLKEEAYRIIKDGKEYFFCSWDCREAFVTGQQH